MDVIPLAALRRKTISLALNRFEKADDRLPPEMIDPWISEAYLLINRRAKLYSRINWQPTTPTKTIFDFPDDLIGRMVPTDGVQIVLSEDGQTLTGREFVNLHWDEFRRRFGNFTVPEGTYGPQAWAFSEFSDNGLEVIGYRKIYVMYPTRITHSAGFKMRYIAHPGQIYRVYDQDSIKATVTRDSPVVTFGSSISGYVAAGDAFGVREADAGGTEGLPRRWYLVESVDSATQITLAEDYERPTWSAATFTISDVSVIERSWNGTCQLAPARYASWQYKEQELGEEHPLTMTEKAKWEAELAEIVAASKVKPAPERKGPPPHTRYAGLRR